MSTANPILVSNWRRNTLRLGLGSICCSCFFLPLSTSLMGLFASLAVLFWLISGDLRELPRVLGNYPFAVPALLLFVYMIAAVTYSPASLDEAIYALKKYRELLLLPIMLGLLSTTRYWQRRAETAFVSGCISLMLISYAMFLDLIPEDRYGHSIVFHITHNFFMALLSFWALNRLTRPSFKRLFWGLIFAAASFNLFYIAPGRTGMLIYIVLVSLFLFARLSWKQGVGACLILSALLVGCYLTSTNLQSRVDQAVQEVRSYQPGSSRTSSGQRLDWWLSSLEMIQHQPLFGHGTGSYAAVQQQLPAQAEIKPTNNPHNEYLFIGVQLGLSGLVLFLAIFALQFHQCRRLPAERRLLVHGVITAMLVGCLFNSFLFDSLQGHFYILLSAVLMTGPEQHPEPVPLPLPADQ